MRFALPLACLPLLGACTGTPMGADAAAMMDSAAAPDASRVDGAIGVDAADGVDAPVGGCTYPGDAVEPMALGAALWPYRWPEAINLADGRNVPLDLVDAFCTADENIDWSPFDILVFIAVPGW